MIKTKKQHFCCVETKQLKGGSVVARQYYSVVRENEIEYTVTDEKEEKEFIASREELLSCGYLC